MSGKKSCEVVDLLERGLKARDMTNDFLNRSLDDHQSSILKDSEALRDIQKKLGPLESLSEEATAMFGEEGRKQANMCGALREKIMGLSVNEESANNCVKKMRGLDKEVRDCDDEAASIRRAIASKYDYCDDEYRRAKVLKQRYENLAAERRHLNAEMQTASSKASSVLRNAKAETERFEEIRKAVREMNSMAENRKAANELRGKMEQAWRGIPQDWAKKFFATRQAELKEKLSAINGKSDEVTIREAPALKSEIDSFRSELAEKIAVWKREKGEAEEVWHQTETVVSSDFVDPWDYNDNPEKPKKSKLFSYIGNYEKKDYEKEYDEKIAQAKKAMSEDRFIDAKKAYEAAKVIADEACSYALELQERMIKKFELAAAIEDVMYKMNYGTDFITIDDNSSKGFRIVCRAGSEVIDFTRIDYDKNGNPIVEVDHKEPDSGDCHKSWQSLTKAMRQQGIPLTDVKKNGRSIIAAATKKSDSSEAPQTILTRG